MNQPKKYKVKTTKSRSAGRSYGQNNWIFWPKNRLSAGIEKIF